MSTAQPQRPGPAFPPMPAGFLQTAYGWIPPSAVARVARQLRDEPTAARAPGDAAWMADEGAALPLEALEWLLPEFLARFEVPEDLIELTRSMAPDAFDEVCLADVRAIRFRGEILTLESEDLPTGAFLGVKDEWATVTLVTHALSVMVEKALEIADVYAKNARAAGERGVQWYTFEHFQPEPFATYIELLVARSLLGGRLLPHPYRAARLRRQAFPAFNVVSRAPVDAALMAEARESARTLARDHYDAFGTPVQP